MPIPAMSRRRVLLSSAFFVGFEAASSQPVHAIEVDDFVMDLVPNLASLTAIRSQVLKGVQPRKAATLKASPANPYLRPVGPRLSAAEQASTQSRIATGPGL